MEDVKEWEIIDTDLEIKNNILKLLGGLSLPKANNILEDCLHVIKTSAKIPEELVVG